MFWCYVYANETFFVYISLFLAVLKKINHIIQISYISVVYCMDIEMFCYKKQFRFENILKMCLSYAENHARSNEYILRSQKSIFYRVLSVPRLYYTVPCYIMASCKTPG